MSTTMIVVGAVAIWAALTLLTIAFVYRATKGRDGNHHNNNGNG